MEFDYELLRNCGKDVYISPKATIKHPRLVSIGSHVAIDECIITVQDDLGDYIHISPYVTIIGGIKAFFQMGHFTAISAGVRIVCAGDGWMGDGFIGPAGDDSLLVSNGRNTQTPAGDDRGHGQVAAKRNDAHKI